jgi:hypothetical protein
MLSLGSDSVGGLGTPKDTVSLSGKTFHLKKIIKIKEKLNKLVHLRPPHTLKFGKQQLTFSNQISRTMFHIIQCNPESWFTGRAAQKDISESLCAAHCPTKLQLRTCP